MKTLGCLRYRPCREAKLNPCLCPTFVESCCENCAKGNPEKASGVNKNGPELLWRNKTEHLSTQIDAVSFAFVCQASSGPRDCPVTVNRSQETERLMSAAGPWKLAAVMPLPQKAMCSS